MCSLCLAFGTAQQPAKIAPKDVAANWVMERLPVQHQPVLLEAQQAYLGQGMDCLASRADQLTAFIYFVKHEAASLLGSRQ